MLAYKHSLNKIDMESLNKSSYSLIYKSIKNNRETGKYLKFRSPIIKTQMMAQIKLGK